MITEKRSEVATTPVSLTDQGRATPGYDFAVTAMMS